MKGLTDRQQEILDFISEFTRQEGMAPTNSEIAHRFDIKSATAFAHVKALERKGYVTRSSKARSLSVLHADRPKHLSLTLSVPILGRISAGVPLLAEENIERKIQVDPAMLPRGLGGHKLFGLIVQGDSMKDMGIYEGDIVIAKKVEQASIGDIVIAIVEGGETTIKSLYLSDSMQYELRPANKEYRSRYYDYDKLAIQGVVVALQRLY
ncbi:MAG: transcriptional repressor LexA [Lentisphaerae bacterium]|jgi:repressor LexA|nr:transcriptional repressor LexA [Lentisphaerota bacterium]